MKLRTKTLLVIGLIALGLAAVTYVISSTIVLNSYRELEKQATTQDVQRATNGLSSELVNLSDAASDYAFWDDTYTFAEDGNSAYVPANLMGETFQNLRLNLIMIVDSASQVKAAVAYDLDRQQLVPVPAAMQKRIIPGDRLLEHPTLDSSVTGIVVLPEGPMLVASRPILTSNKTGPSRGAFIMGRYLSPDEVNRLAQITQLFLNVYRLDDAQLPADVKAVQSALSDKTPIVSRPLNEETVAGYTILNDLDGNPALLLRVDNPRTIYKQGQSTIIYLIASLLAIGLTFGAAIYVLVERLIVRRVTRLSAAISRVHTSYDLSMQIPVGGKDEISDLADSFNAMAAQLRQSVAALEERVAERSGQLNVSAEMSRAITSILDPAELMQQVVTLITTRFGMYYAAIFLADDDHEYAVLREATGEAGQTLKEQGHKLELAGHSMVSEAIATHHVRLAQDVERETMRFANPLLTETRSEIALPLLIGDRAIGALDVQSTQLNAFDEGAVTVLQGLADQVAIALNNARAYQSAQLDARQAAALFEASQATSHIGEDFHVTVNRLFGVVAQRSDFDTWMAAEFDERHQTYTILTAFDANEPAPLEDVGLAVRVDRQAATPAALTIQAKQLVIINAAETDPRLAAMPPETRMVLGKVIGAPAMIGNRLMGVITLGRTPDKANINPRDIQLAQAIASQLAVAMENHRLFEQARQSAAELNQLMRLYTHQGWTSFSQSRSPQALMHEYSRPGVPPINLGVLPQLDRAARAALPTPTTVGFDGQTIVGVPIILRGEVLGTLNVQDDEDRRWTDDELATLQAVADQIAQSMEAARLLEDSEASLQETTTLYQATRAIATASTLQEALQAVVSTIYQRVRADQVRLVLFDEELGYGTVRAEAVPTPGIENVRLPTTGNPTYEVLAKTRRPVAVYDVATDPITAAVADTLTTLGIKSMLLLPIVVGHQLVGSVGVDSNREHRRYTDKEIVFCETLMRQAAFSIENRRLFQDVSDRVNELTALTRIGRRLASTLDLDEILNSIVDEVLMATEATHASIALYNEPENALEVKVMRGFTPEVEADTLGLLIRPGQGLHGRMLTTGQAVLVDDVTLDPDYMVVNADTRSEYIIPIRQSELLLGALNLESPRVHAFRESDVHLIEALADQAAIAITNARAYEAERQAVERMREVDRLKTQFLANMSHELRTPLNSIIGFSRVILRGIDGPLTEVQQTDLNSIYNSGQHLLGLINNILDLSKIEAGKMELTIEPVDLREVAKSVMSTAIALVKDRPIKLEQEIPEDLAAIIADQTRVRQIMLNLVSNAAKFTDHGSIKLSIVSSAQEVRISVADTGIGIPLDKVDHIFEEFTQIDASTTRRVGGTGLGLAITRRFVEMHHGRIWVESQLGVGSTFTFTLPREQPKIEEPVALPADLAARGEGKKLILCIDDDPGVITLYKRYLEKQGYSVIGVTDSTKAIDEAKRLLPFAITLDVLMPNRDGWALLADLKKSPELSQTPIIVCSIIQDRTKGYALGATDYLVKPITEEELMRTLERVNKAKTIHKVLAVDDEPPALMLIKRLVETRPDYQVTEANGGAQALAKIETERPDLIILDLMMPEIDGFAVLESVKSSPITRHIPIIIVTAKELTQEDRTRLEGKTIAVFNKGMFNAEQLLLNIAEALTAMNGVKVTAGQPMS